MALDTRLEKQWLQKEETPQISSLLTSSVEKKSSEMKKCSLTQKSYITIETKGIVPQKQNTTPKQHQQATAQNSFQQIN